MTDGDMGWDTPGPYNAPPEAEDAAMDRPSPQENVGNDQNNDHLLTPKSNMGDGERQGVESCLVYSKNGAGQIRHRPRISYCEAANWGLAKADAKQ